MSDPIRVHPRSSAVPPAVYDMSSMIGAERLARGLYWSRAWSLVEGCTPVSPACDHCWAAGAAHMRRCNPNDQVRAHNAGLTTPDGRFNGTVRTNGTLLSLPERAKKPAVWAVWTDLHHSRVPGLFVADAYGTMNAARQHLFLVCTKRPENLVQYVRQGIHPMPPNVIHMTTAENQEQADKRIPALLEFKSLTGGLVGVSLEPMLGGMQVWKYLTKNQRFGRDAAKAFHCDNQEIWVDGLDWVILGGESGPHARPMHPDWARGVRDQCQAAGVPFFFKQWGRGYPDERPFMGAMNQRTVESGTGAPDAVMTNYDSPRRAGRLLDGKRHQEFPLLDPNSLQSKPLED